MTCAPAVPDLEFAATSTYRSVLENVVSTTFTLNFSTATHSAGTAYISLDATSTAAHPADYNSTSFSGAMIQVAFPANGATTSFITTIVNDGLPESAEYVLFTLDSVSYTSGITVGTVNKSTLVISDVVTVPTVLNPGDLVIVGVNANNNVCASNPVSIDDDQISFFCFKDITPNTQLILTDNGYERCFATLWANSEGTLRITRTGNSIPAGQVITLRMTNSVGSGNVLGLAPDASWSCASIGSAGTMLQFNSNGDQIFFMQGGGVGYRKRRCSQRDLLRNNTLWFFFQPAVPLGGCMSKHKWRSSVRDSPLQPASRRGMLQLGESRGQGLLQVYRSPNCCKSTGLDHSDR
jgi:hypothetical protein